MELEKLLKLHEQLEKATQIAREEIVKQINSWQSLADMGFTIEAIKFYRKQHNSTLKSAHEHVIAFQKMMKE